MYRFFNWIIKLWKKRESDEEGPINQLPNELIQQILAKFNLDDDMKKLVRLRLVSTRWRDQVEEYCRTKKSLIVDMKSNVVSSSEYTRFFEEKFLRFAKLKDFSCLSLNPSIPSECLLSLLNLFPNLEELTIRCTDQAPVSDLTFYLNSLDSLNKLHIDGPFDLALPNLSQTLSKLEHFSINTARLSNHVQLISHLGTNCVRVYFESRTHQILQWHSINPNWLANVTHLGIFCDRGRYENHQVVPYLGEHAPSLKLLNIYFYNVIFGPIFTSTQFDDLGKLTNLVELELWNIYIDLSEFEEQQATGAKLTSLSSLLICRLHGFTIDYEREQKIIVNQFTRIFSIIFPNLIELYLGFVDERKRPAEIEFRDDVEPYLGRFPDLRKHEIVFD